MATKCIVKHLKSLKKGPYIHDTDAWQHTGSLLQVHFYFIYTAVPPYTRVLRSKTYRG
jgi:hypothetical protein